MRTILGWLMEKHSPGIQRHERLGRWAQEYFDEVDRLLTLQFAIIDWWKRSGRLNLVVEKRVALRHKHIMWLLARGSEMQAEQEEIQAGWS